MSIQFTDLTADSDPPVGVDLFVRLNNGYGVCQYIGGDVLDSYSYRWPGNLYLHVPDSYAVI